MKCWDDRANVGYPDHEEWVAPGPNLKGSVCLGICARCGEITDLKACRLMAARGRKVCQEALAKAGNGQEMGR